MRILEATDILHRFQKFRRGKETMQDLGLTPEKVGRALDCAIRALRRISYYSEIGPKTKLGEVLNLPIANSIKRQVEYNPRQDDICAICQNQNCIGLPFGVTECKNFE